MRKNTWYAVYHQRELDYLARSYQPGYFFILMGGIDTTRYLPIDGSKPMEGDLDLAGYNLLTTYISLRPISTLGLRVMDRAGTNYRDWYVRTLQFELISGKKNAAEIQARANEAASITFYGYHGGGRVQVGKIDDDFWTLDRAGNITLLSNKILDVINGVLRFPDTRPAVPTAGDVRYDAATDTFEIYDGAAWNAH